MFRFFKVIPGIEKNHFGPFEFLALVGFCLNLMELLRLQQYHSNYLHLCSPEAPAIWREREHCLVQRES